MKGLPSGWLDFSTLSMHSTGWQSREKQRVWVLQIDDLHLWRLSRVAKLRMIFLLKVGKTPIEIYFNASSSLADAIVVTSAGLILKTESGWLSIPYKMIAKVVMPARIGCLAQVRELTLTLLGGKSLALPILGGTERTADAFEFSRFLNRFRSDLERRP